MLQKRAKFKDVVAAGVPQFRTARPLLREGVMLPAGSVLPLESLPPRRLKLLYEQRHIEPMTDAASSATAVVKEPVKEPVRIERTIGSPGYQPKRKMIKK